MKKVGLFFLVLALFPAQSMLAWNQKAHRLIAEIAKGQVKKEVAELVDFYLKGMSWEDAAVWMESEANKSAPHQSAWHFHLTARDKTYTPVRFPSLVNQIEEQLSIIDKRDIYPMKNITEAIMVLFHLVGDLHQPLHCGFPDDNSGKTVQLNWSGRETNLYELWDRGIIEELKIDMWGCSRILLATTQQQRSNIQKHALASWYEDSRSQLKEVYSFSSKDLDAAYLEKSKELIEKQIVKAGLRLAGILNKAFKD